LWYIEVRLAAQGDRTPVLVWAGTRNHEGASVNQLRPNRLTLILLAVAVALSVYALGCNSKDKNPTGPGPTPADVTINILGNNGSNSYSPSPDTVTVGQTVAWHNNDSMTHTATSTSGTAIGTGGIAPGATSAKVAMNTAGTFNYHCTIHPTMTGILVVKP
jgi:plastocyanin